MFLRLQCDVVLSDVLESLGGGGDGVVSRQEEGNHVLAGGIADGGVDRSGLGLLDGHGGTFDGSAAWIGDGAGEGATKFLGSRGRYCDGDKG